MIETMLKININSSSRYPIDRKRMKRKIEKVLKKHGVVEGIELGVFVIGDRKMVGLNKKFMKKEGTTDVLSFPMTNQGDDLGFVEPSEIERLYLGDIFVSFPQARKQAAEGSLLVDEEIDKLVEHGVLHLLGKHHD